MHGTFLIEVGYQDSVIDPIGNSLRTDVQHLGLSQVPRIRVSQLYRIVGDLTPEEHRRIAGDLLCDSVIQQASDGELRVPIRNNKKGSKTVAVDVWFKQGVTDVVGESVAKGICDLNISGVAEVRTGSRYRFWNLGPKEVEKKIALTLLANLLVHEYVIHDRT